MSEETTNEPNETTEPAMEAAAEPVMEDAAEPVMEEVAEPVMEEVAEPVTIRETVTETPAPSQSQAAPAKQGGGKKVRQGKVVSNKANKTIVVSIERQVAHPIYKRYFKQTKKVMAHDENNDCNIGDVVRVIESRPLSARKRWTLLEIVERAQ
jgi:small subunit ribosomal protein S17